MKKLTLKLYTLIIVCMSSFNVKSQTIINMAGDNNTYPHGYLSTGQYYIKDVYNYLDDFVGTWEYINGNEKFQIILIKITKYHYINSRINLDFYEDGIVLKYKKFVNNILVFESPYYSEPNFSTEGSFILQDDRLLKGYITDYGRVTKTIYAPFSTTVILWEGGDYIYPHCFIQKVPNNPNKITFKLDLTDTVNYDRETYSGQPTYSIPNDIIMNKI